MSEIKDICRQAQSIALMYAVEIGRRLVEAKGLSAALYSFKDSIK